MRICENLSRSSGIRGKLWGRLDQRQSCRTGCRPSKGRRGNGQRRPVFSSGNSANAVRRSGPGSCSSRTSAAFAASSARPNCASAAARIAERLKMIGIHVQGFARPGKRSVILPEQIMAERVQGRQLIRGSLLPRCAAIENSSMAWRCSPHHEDDKMPEHAARAHVVWV